VALVVRPNTGAELAVHELGGTGPPLVMVHAAGLHGLVWGPVATHLARSFRCLAPDVAGHGYSAPAPADRTDWPTLAEDVLATVDELGLERPYGLGHSMGATLLLLAEQTRPGLFAGLYCFEPIGVASDEAFPASFDHPMAIRARRRRPEFESREAAVEAFGAKRPFSGVTAEALAAYVEHGFVDTGHGTVALRCSPDHEADVFAHGLSHPAFHDLERVRCPTTFAVGARSEVLSPDVLQRWAERMPAATVEVVADSGHFAPLEVPSALAAAVARALVG